MDATTAMILKQGFEDLGIETKKEEIGGVYYLVFMDYPGDIIVDVTDLVIDRDAGFIIGDEVMELLKKKFKVEKKGVYEYLS